MSHCYTVLVAFEKEVQCIAFNLFVSPCVFEFLKKCSVLFFVCFLLSSCTHVAYIDQFGIVRVIVNPLMDGDGGRSCLLPLCPLQLHWFFNSAVILLALCQ